MYTIILHDINSVDLKNNGSTASKSLTPVARAKWSKMVLFRAVGRLGENETERSFFWWSSKAHSIALAGTPQGLVTSARVAPRREFSRGQLEIFF